MTQVYPAHAPEKHSSVWCGPLRQSFLSEIVLHGDFENVSLLSIELGYGAGVFDEARVAPLLKESVYYGLYQGAGLQVYVRGLYIMGC